MYNIVLCTAYIYESYINNIIFINDASYNVQYIGQLCSVLSISVMLKDHIERDWIVALASHGAVHRHLQIAASPSHPPSVAVSLHHLDEGPDVVATLLLIQFRRDAEGETTIDRAERGFVHCWLEVGHESQESGLVAGALDRGFQCRGQAVLLKPHNWAAAALLAAEQELHFQKPLWIGFRIEPVVTGLVPV